MELVPVFTPTPSAVSTSGLCQVCFQEGHGTHFGAFTCRACAAFFRRCHVSPKGALKCVKSLNECQPRLGRWICKRCRLERCLKLGMTTTNIQFHRDSFTSSENFMNNRLFVRRMNRCDSLPMTVEQKLGIPHLAAFFRRKTDEHRSMPFVNIDELVRKARKSLLECSPELGSARKFSDLEQLAVGLEELQMSQKENLLNVSALGKEIQMNDWERGMCTTAKWLTYSDRIRSLDKNVKIVFLQSIWNIWSRLERIGMTARMRVNGLCGKEQFVMSADKIVNYEGTEVDISWASEYSYEELAYFFIPTEIFYEEVITEVINVRPDSVEMAFILIIICVHIAGLRNNGEIAEEMEELQDIMANDLHNYYIQKNMTRYSARLKQLMKIKECFLMMWQKRKEKFEVGAVFEFFRMQYSVPGYFHTPC